MKKLSVCLGLLLLNASYAQSMFKGSEGGGGGDASEERVSEIRADILSWIEKGGSKGLNLPDGISLNDYNQKMSELLQPKTVVITFVSKDDSKDEELQVNVNGKPKTCRGFYSRKDTKPHMICNIGRFKETSPSDQYKLIHHEYAGLAYLERNEGAASDYVISNQLRGYLTEVKILKLAVKKFDSKEHFTSIEDFEEVKKVSCLEIAEDHRTRTDYYLFECSNEKKLRYLVTQISKGDETRLKIKTCKYGTTDTDEWRWGDRKCK